MRALILTAGLGTRLRPLTFLRAKAAVPVNGETLVRRIIRSLTAQGITDLVLNLHHRPETIAASVGDGRDLGARVRYSWENPVLGSAGGPRHALPLLAGDSRHFLIVNGDTLTDLDLDALAATHERMKSAVTLALVPNPRPDTYGGVLVTDGYVTGFSRAGGPGESYHFIGIQMAHHGAFAGLPDGIPSESVNQVYPRLIAADPAAIAAHVCTASFHDIGTPADYLNTCLELARQEGDRLTNGARAHIADSARISRSVLWDDVAVGPRARLDSCIVCDGAHVAADASFERCAILPASMGSPGGNEQVIGDLLVHPIP